MHRFTRASAHAGTALLVLLGTAGVSLARPDAQPAAQTSAKADAKPDARPDAKTDAKPAAKPDARPRAKADAWTRIAWEAQPVRYPVAPAQVQPEPPHVPAQVDTVAGVIEIGPERAAAFWMDALDVRRVRRVEQRAGAAEHGAATRAPNAPNAGSAPALVLRRVVGTPAGMVARTRGEVEEAPALVAPGIWHVAQHPEHGDVWVITATAPMRVVIERPTWRDDARLWEETRGAVLQWIERGGAMPEILPGPDSLALGLGLRADHALARLLTHATAPRLGQAVRAWRQAAALTRLAVVGAHRQPYHWFEDHTAALATAARSGPPIALSPGARGHARIDAETFTWSARLEGPGVLEIDAHALLPEPARGGDTGSVRVTAAGRVLVEHRYQRRPTYVHAGASSERAFPRRVPRRAPGGQPVGPRERLRVPLLPGQHSYELALRGGPSLVRVRVVRRRPRLREALRRQAHPGDFIAAAEAALAGDDSQEAAVLAQLLAEMRGRVAARPAPRAPSAVLALVADISRWRGRQVDPAALQALLELSRPVLAHPDPDIDPALFWTLRRDLAEIAASAGAAGADALIAATRDAGALPPVVAARMAELVTLAALDHADAADARAWALAAAQRAWQAEPLDGSMQRIYRQVWRHATSWSRLERARAAAPAARAPASGDTGTALDRDQAATRAGALAAADELPAYRFIERVADSDAQERAQATPADTRELWPIALGQRQRVLALPSPVDHRRPVVLRAYVATPLQAQGSLRLRVDEQVFPALPLAPVEVLEVAVAPGTHEVVLEGPAGTEAFLSMGPETPAAQRARVRTLRPAWDHGRAARYAVPAAARGMPVRVTLRVTRTDAGNAEPVRVRLRTDTGYTRSIAVSVGSASSPSSPSSPTGPSSIDTSRLPIDGMMPMSAAVRTVLWLPPDARWLWLEPEQPHAVSQVWASLSMRQPGSRPLAASALAASAGAPDHDGDSQATPQRSDTTTKNAGHASARAWDPGDPEWTERVNEIAEVSRALVSSPDGADLRLRRVARLLDIAEVGRVALDWAWLTAISAAQLLPAQRQARDDLARRIAAWRDSRYLPVQPRPFTTPVALVPAAMALVSDPAQLDPWQPAALAARRGERTLLYAFASERDTLLARYYQAEMLRSQGAHASAARLLRAIYDETGAPAIGIEALRAFEAALARRPPGRATGQSTAHAAHAAPTHAAPTPAPAESMTDLASLAYGLALTMREHFAHPVVRRVLFAAARRSRWEPLRGTAGSAGFESIRVDEELLDPEPDAVLERALVAPPWPREQASVVHPGRGALLALDLEAPARVRAEAWCQRLRPSDDARSACAVRWRVDGRAEQAREVPLARVTSFGAMTLAAGHHELEVLLDDDDPTVRLAVRFATSRALAGEPDGAAISILRPGRLHVADAEHPVEATVLGPTTLRVEARRYMEDPPVTLVAEARPTEARPTEAHRPAAHAAAATLQRELRIDAAQDPSAIGDARRKVRLSSASTAVLVLPAPTTYRVVLRPQGGRAVVRLWHRRDVSTAPPTAPPTAEATAPQPDTRPTPPTAAPPAPGTDEWPALLEPGRGLIAPAWQPAAASPWPTLSAGLSFRRDDLADRDLDAEPLENRLQLDLAWRRQLVPARLWLRLESALRWHPGSTPAYGASLDLSLRRLALGLRLDAMARAFAQSAADTWAWTAQGRVRVGRSFRVRPLLTLVPTLAVQARFYSLDPASAPAGAAFDPLVYNAYDRAHRYGLRPEATLNWRPFQDQLALASVRLVTNEDFYSPDRAEVELAWRGLVPWSRFAPPWRSRRGIPLFELHYRPGHRFDDAGRSRGYVRHDLGARLDWSLWNGRAGRWLLEVRDEVYLSTGVGNRNVFLIGVRYDAVDGRGLRDMLPIEYRFDELIEPPPWAD
jgi:hypothetical protein